MNRDHRKERRLMINTKRLHMLDKIQQIVLKRSDPRGLYGKVDMILMHDSLVVKYPTEVEACGEMFDPNNARYVPAPSEASHLRCHGCRKMKKPGQFGRDARCIHRQGRRTDCHECRNAKLKSARLTKRKERKQAA